MFLDWNFILFFNIFGLVLKWYNRMNRSNNVTHFFKDKEPLVWIYTTSCLFWITYMIISINYFLIHLKKIIWNIFSLLRCSKNRSILNCLAFLFLIEDGAYLHAIIKFWVEPWDNFKLNGVVMLREGSFWLTLSPNSKRGRHLPPRI